LVVRSVKDVSEVVASVAGAVVRGDSFDRIDAVGSEPGAGVVHESNCRDGLFVSEGCLQTAK
jgi:hypothetical protein